MAKKAKTPDLTKWVAELINPGPLAQTWRWLVKDERKTVVCFVEKWKPKKGYQDPYKVFTAICGQGPVHMGEMVTADYGARNAIEAAVAAFPNGG